MKRIPVPGWNARSRSSRRWISVGNLSNKYLIWKRERLILPLSGDPNLKIPSLTRRMTRIILLAAAAGVAHAQVTVTSRTGAVAMTSGMSLGFSAAHADGVPRRWHWSIDEVSDSGSFVSAQGRARIAYRAPRVLWTKTFHVRATAEDGSCTGATAITVLPRAGVLGAGARLTTHDKASAMGIVGPVLDRERYATPVLEPFAGVLPGHPDGLGWDARDQVVSLASVSDPDPDMAALDGQWLAGTATGLLRLPGPGACAPIPLRGRLCATMEDTDAGLFPEVRCESIATRPAGGASGRHVVVLLSRLEGPMEGTFICSLGQDGTLRPIAGAEITRGKRKPTEGPGAEVDLRWARSIVLDRRGDILVVMPNRVLRVDGAGQVTPLAGHAHQGGSGIVPRDGRGEGATFENLLGGALDPDSGDLYVSDGGTTVRRVTPTGEVTTLLGTPDQDQPIPVLPGGAHMPLGRPCLRYAVGLAFSAGILYLDDDAAGAVLAFNPGNRFLYRLAGRHPVTPTVYFGPLPIFAEGMPAAQTACIGRPRCLAVQDQHVLLACRVLSPKPHDAMVHFQLPPGAFGAALPSPPAAEAGPGEEKTESKEERKSTPAATE